MASSLLPRAQAALVGPQGIATREFYNFLLSLAEGTEDSELQAQILALAARVAALEAEEQSGASIQGPLSVSVTGSLNGGVVQISLEGDVYEPGLTFYYGTNASGEKGWYAVADTLMQGDGITLTVNPDGTTEIAHADTSSVTDISASFTGGTVPDEISLTFDQFGHVLTRNITGRTLDHNDTGALQGGNATERYHFTAAEHAGLLPWAGEAPADYEPAIAPGTTAQLWRGDKTWGNNILGNFGVGTPTPGIIGNGRELSVSVDGAVNTLARLNLQGNRNTTTGNIASFTAYNVAVPIAQMTAGCDGATDAGAFTITTKPTGGALTARMTFLSTGPVVPGADNVQTFGSAPLRWSEYFAGNGTINTSDAREKTIRGPLTESELAAAQELASAGVIYQWNHAIEKKGDAARLHFGPTVQAVIAIMQSHGLDPFRYGFVCYDQWDEQPEVWSEWPDLFDEDGNLIQAAGRELTQEYRAAGDRYSLRHDQLLLFIARGQDERLARLEALIPPPAA